jgi:hypothetical protein
VKQHRHDISGICVGNNFFNKLRERSITHQRLLDSLVTELRELGEEELLWCWQVPLNELKFPKLFEVVKIRKVESGNQADHLLRLALSLTLRVPVEVDLWIGWHRVVNYHVEIIKRHSASSNVGKNEARDLLLLNLLNCLAQFDLGNVSNELERGHSALLQDHVGEISVRRRVTKNDA